MEPFQPLLFTPLCRNRMDGWTIGPVEVFGKWRQKKRFFSWCIDSAHFRRIAEVRTRLIELYEVGGGGDAVHNQPVQEMPTEHTKTSNLSRTHTQSYTFLSRLRFVVVSCVLNGWSTIEKSGHFSVGRILEVRSKLTLSTA